MKNIEDLQRDAQNKCREAEYRQRVQQRQARLDQEKLAQRQNFAIGELVARYFPELREITPGTKAENAERYSKLEECLRRLAANPKFILNYQRRQMTAHQSAMCKWAHRSNEDITYGQFSL